MAIPKTLHPIPKEKAERTIAKHLAAGTGEWEYEPWNSDFVYETPSGGANMIRPNGNGTYEGGRVCM